MKSSIKHALWVVGLGCGLALAGDPGKHVHGVANLEVAVDGSTLTLHFSSPLDNLVGFEHAPRTAAQKTAAQNMTERLRKADTLFQPTPAARCALVSSKLDAPVLESKPADPPKKAASAPAQKPAGKAKRAHEREEEHAALSADILFRCDSVDSLKDIEVKLFEHFRTLRRLDVQVATANGQVARRLTPKERKVTW